MRRRLSGWAKAWFALALLVWAFDLYAVITIASDLHPLDTAEVQAIWVPASIIAFLPLAVAMVFTGAKWLWQRVRPVNPP